MSSNVFPTLPGQIIVERSPSYVSTIHQTVSGLEQRTSWRTNPVWHYRITETVRQGTAAPSPWGAYNEHSILVKWIDDHKGAWDSFLLVDPINVVSSGTIPGTPYQVTVSSTGLAFASTVGVTIAGVAATLDTNPPDPGQYYNSGSTFTFNSTDATKAYTITWSGHRRVRFVEDTLTFGRVVTGWWSCEAKFVSVTA